jgi:hypothetical protein
MTTTEDIGTILSLLIAIIFIIFILICITPNSNKRVSKKSKKNRKKKCVKLATKNNFGLVDTKNGNYIFTIENGILGILSKKGNYFSNSKSKVLTSPCGEMIVENIYVHRSNKQRTIYKCIENDDVELIITNDTVMCKNLDNFPGITNVRSAIKPKRSPKKKIEKLKRKTKKKPEKTKKDSSDETICKICFEKKISTVLLNCGHAGLCSDCLSNKDLNNCPFCRKEITTFIRNVILQ